MTPFSGEGRCRSCGARITWLLTSKGKSMPVDAEPAAGGNLQIGDDGVVTVVKAGEGTHVSHFATCPSAAAHRKAAT